MEKIDSLESEFTNLIAHEFPAIPNSGTYLNTGSCGRKPRSVLESIQSGWERLNANPTIMTFLSDEPISGAREALSRLMDVPQSSLLLTQNSTQCLQLMLTNLLQAGDELVTTDKEHGCVRAIARYLEEMRGVTTRRYPVDPFEGSKNFCNGMMNLVTSNTKVILVSVIGSYNTWRPNLSMLQEAVRGTRIELIVDGAHAPGQGVCRPGKYRLWNGSGHKWLGGPNGTGFAILPPDLVPGFQPTLIGDEHFVKKDLDASDLRRFESSGTSDIARWFRVGASVRTSDG